MVSDATGFEATIPARVTATTVSWEIHATDIWGNTAIVATGFYTRSEGTTDDVIDPNLMLALQVGGVALLAVIVIVVLRRRRK